MVGGESLALAAADVSRVGVVSRVAEERAIRLTLVPLKADG
jgi:hypothetical protein